METILKRLAFGFVSRHETIRNKCIQFFQEVFKQIRAQSLDSAGDRSNSWNHISKEGFRKNNSNFPEKYSESEINSEISDNFLDVLAKEKSPESPTKNSSVKNSGKKIPSPVNTKAVNSIISDEFDVNFRDWHMYDNFLELFFRGMEKNFAYEKECIDILLSMDNNNLNACLKKLAKDEKHL